MVSPRTVAFLEIQVGEHVLLCDPEEVLAVESGGVADTQDVIRSIDLREVLDTSRTSSTECLLVAGGESLYRLQVCSVRQFIHRDLACLHRVPALLLPLCQRLGLRGLVEIEEDRWAYVVDLTRLAEATGKRATA
jgi:hypothetical protein